MTLEDQQRPEKGPQYEASECIRDITFNDWSKNGDNMKKGGGTRPSLEGGVTGKGDHV